MLISIAFISIFATVMVTMISVGTKSPDGFKIHATMETDLSKAFLAVCNIVFAYGEYPGEWLRQRPSDIL